MSRKISWKVWSWWCLPGLGWEYLVGLSWGFFLRDLWWFMVICRGLWEKFCEKKLMRLLFWRFSPLFLGFQGAEEVFVGLLEGVQGGGGNWGTLRIPFGKIGEPLGRLGNPLPLEPPRLNNPITRRGSLEVFFSFFFSQGVSRWWGVSTRVTWWQICQQDRTVYSPENYRLDTQNGGLEKLIPFKYCHCWYLITSIMITDDYVKFRGFTLTWCPCILIMIERWNNPPTRPCAVPKAYLPNHSTFVLIFAIYFWMGKPRQP